MEILFKHNIIVVRICAHPNLTLRNIRIQTHLSQTLYLTILNTLFSKFQIAYEYSDLINNIFRISFFFFFSRNIR
jgi:hypothetical protein